MQCKIVREKEFCTGHSTGGSWYVNGVWQCHTLEDPLREYPHKVDGDTAIWPGIYRVVIDWSPKKLAWMLHVLDVPMFTGIRIHPGNTEGDTEGCILVGRVRKANWIGESVLAYNALCEKLSSAIARDGVFTLEVINP